MRTRADGSPLSWDGLEQDIYEFGTIVPSLAHELRRDAQELARKEFDDGLQLGARIEHRAAVEATCNALLEILGKDAGDGVIALGAAGRWYRGTDGWKPAAEFDYTDDIGGASK